MSNAYIIDAFLSFWAWLTLAWLCVSIGNDVKKLNHMTNKTLFAFAVESLAKRSIILSLPFLITFAFLLYRFASLLYQANMGGIGAIGLMVIMTISGLVMIWLKVLFILIIHSDYVKASKKLDEFNKSKNAPPKRAPI